jgi:hypothetical protein
MEQTLIGFLLIAAGAGAFTAAVIGHTLPESLGALAGAFVGMLVALGVFSLQSSTVKLTPGTGLEAAVAALWASMLTWLAILWWESRTGRIPPA